jgi:beta-lactamase family protein
MWCFSGMLASVPAQSPIMVYTGETTEGQSGSPVWIEQDGKRNLVGIVVARGNVNRVVRITWGVVEQLNNWMLNAENPTREFEFEQLEGESQGVYEVLPVQLGEFEENQVAPKNLLLFDHTHRPKTPDSAHPGTFVAGTSTKLTSADMNPLFFGASGSVILDSTPTGLQHCLNGLIATGFSELLGTKGQTGPGARDIVHVALVDLTKAKLSAPDLAAWGGPVDMYGASVPKILALYAAFQLRADLRNLIARTSPADGKQLESSAIAEWKAKGGTKQFPDLVWLFDIRKWTAAASLDFTADARSSFANISHNCEAGTLIAKVSLPYIGSVTWQSGLLRPTASGLWLKGSYCDKASWDSPVNTPFTHNATALSAATYFTLLAQGRLVDDSSSADIRNALQRGCVTSLFPALPVVASKCGIYGGYIHDCAWIQDAEVRYVIAVLSKLSTPKQHQQYTQLIAQLDTLIRQNN